MRLVEIVGVRVEMPTKQPLVLLKESDGPRYLPIWIGPVEATAIALAQQGVRSERPQTHELVVALVEALGDELSEVHITRLEEGVFFAEMVFGSGTRVEARPSDSLAVALRVGARVLVDDDVLDEAGVVAEQDEDAEIERFREFLDDVTPEDFQGPDEPSSET